MFKLFSIFFMGKIFLTSDLDKQKNIRQTESTRFKMSKINEWFSKDRKMQKSIKNILPSLIFKISEKICMKSFFFLFKLFYILFFNSILC